MPDSTQSLSAIRERIAGDWQSSRATTWDTIRSGYGALDGYLDGGFRRGQLHEIFASDAEDNGSAAGFTAMLALCAAQSRKKTLWLRTLDAPRRGGRFNSVGLAELGGDPATLIMAVAPDDTVLLRSAADALRCKGFGSVIIECWGSPAILDLTASRRLTLAARQAGVTAFMLRLGAQEQPSTADTRWSVQSAPSVPLEANAPGHPVLDVTLLRQRSGPAGKHWRMEWNRDQRSFQEPTGIAHYGNSLAAAPVSGAMVSVSASEPAAHSWGLKRRA